MSYESAYVSFSEVPLTFFIISSDSFDKPNDEVKAFDYFNFLLSSSSIFCPFGSPPMSSIAKARVFAESPYLPFGVTTTLESLSKLP